MSHLNVFRIFRNFFSQVISNINEVLSGEQEKIIYYLCKDVIENPSLTITDCHHLSSLVIPICDLRDRFIYTALLHMIDSYNLSLAIIKLVLTKLSTLLLVILMTKQILITI